MEKKFHYAWLIFGATCLISLIGFGMLLNTIGLYFEPISKAFNVGIGDVSFMATGQNLAAAVTLLFAGKLMEKYNYKLILVICWCLIGGGLISLGYATSLVHLYIVWILIGISQPFAIALSIPVLLGNWFSEKFGTVMGIAMALSAVGGTIFNPIFSYIIRTYGWQQSFIVEGIIVLVILVPVSLFVVKYRPTGAQTAYGTKQKVADEVEVVQENEGMLLGEAFRSYKFYALIIAGVSLQWVAGLVQHISAHVVHSGQSLTVGASVISGVMIGATIGKIIIGYLLDKLNNKVVIGLFAVVGALGWGGLIIQSNVSMYVVMGLLLGLGQGLLLVGLPYFIRKIFGTKDYSSILSVISMAGAVAAALSVGIDGKIFDATGSYSIPLILNVVLYAVAAIAIGTTVGSNKKVAVKGSEA